MAYCTKEDMVTRFGQLEILRLVDRGLQKTKTSDQAAVDAKIDGSALLQAKIDDAAAEMDVILSCAYDICKLQTMLADGYSFPALKHWNCDIARKHLYDSIRLNTNAGSRDHQAKSEYSDYEIEIKKLCKDGKLLGYKDGTCLAVEKQAQGTFIISGEKAACIPKLCCEEEKCC